MTYRRGRYYHLDMRLDGWGRLALSTRQKSKRRADQVEAAVRSVHLQGQWHLLDALQAGRLGVAAFYAAYATDRLDELHVGPNPPLTDACDAFSRAHAHDRRYGLAMDRIKAFAPAGARLTWLKDHIRDVVTNYRTLGLAAGTEHRELVGVFLLIAERFGEPERRRLYRETRRIRRRPKGRRDRLLTPREIRALKDAAGDWWLPICLALSTGIRRSELLRLEARDVDGDQLIVRSGKSKAAERAIPLGGEVLGLMRGWLAEQGVTGSDPLFPGLTDHYLTVGWRQVRKTAGVNCVWHTLRHTWATNMARVGTPAHELMRLGGWSSLVTVQKYLKHAPQLGTYVDQAASEMGLGGEKAPTLRPQSGRERRKVGG